MNYSCEKKNAKRNSATGERMKRQKRDKSIEKKEDEMQCQKSVTFCSGKEFKQERNNLSFQRSIETFRNFLESVCILLHSSDKWLIYSRHELKTLIYPRFHSHENLFVQTGTSHQKYIP